MRATTNVETGSCISESSLDGMKCGIKNVILGLSISTIGLIGLFGFTSLLVGVVKSGGIFNTIQMWLGAVVF